MDIAGVVRLLKKEPTPSDVTTHGHLRASRPVEKIAPQMFSGFSSATPQTKGRLASR